MIKVSDVYNAIDSVAPFNTQLGFDNAGLLVGNMYDNVSKIAVALDATPDTLIFAYELGCDMLVTHHPIIFNPVKSLSELDAAYHAIRLGISVISAHTNLDAAKNGVNDCLCNALDLCDVKPMSNGEDIIPLARMGYVRTESILSSFDYAVLIKEQLKCSSVKLTSCKSDVSNVAVCGGAGGDYIIAAMNSGADSFVTGECKHHERLLAKQLGINLFECGHFCTEQLVKAMLHDTLIKICDSVVVIDETDPAIYI